MSPRDTVTDERERKKTACARDMYQYMCTLLEVTFTLLKYQLVHNYHILPVLEVLTLVPGGTGGF